MIREGQSTHRRSHDRSRGARLGAFGPGPWLAGQRWIDEDAAGGHACCARGPGLEPLHRLYAAPLARDHREAHRGPAPLLRSRERNAQAGGRAGRDRAFPASLQRRGRARGLRPQPDDDRLLHRGHRQGPGPRLRRVHRRALPEGNRSGHRPVGSPLLGPPPSIRSHGHERGHRHPREPAFSLGPLDARAAGERPRLPSGAGRHLRLRLQPLVLPHDAGTASGASRDGQPPGVPDVDVPPHARLVSGRRMVPGRQQPGIRPLQPLGIPALQPAARPLRRAVAPGVRRRDQPNDRAPPRQLPVSLRPRRRADPLGPIHHLSLLCFPPSAGPT